MRRDTGIGVLTAVLVLAGCGNDAVGGEDDDSPGGKADSPESRGEPSIYAVGNRLSPVSTDDRYLSEVQPVVARQCVTCHGCGDAPCQLKLSSYESVLRGSNEDDLYATRILGISRKYNPMHLAYGRVLAGDGSIDYDKTEAEWRDIDFYSVLAHDTDSLLARVLTEAHDATTSFDQQYDLAKNLAGRDFECSGSDSPDGDVMVGRAMPLGLAALEDHASGAILDWLEDGAQGPSAEVQLAVAAPANAVAVENWEEFLNPPLSDARAQLVSRYLYEHLFFADLHLEASAGEFYRLVRSRTRKGPIDEIVTERPFDVPKEDEVFYRLQKITQVLAAKSHVPWKISRDTRERWNELFFGSDWSLDDNPDFEPDSDNPFGYFAAIPAEARYRFMLDHSKELVDAMVRGSVCTGSGATFAIRDRFWVWFLDPASDVSALDSVAGERTGGPRLGEDSWFHLNPESANPVRENDYLRAYRTQLQKHRPDGIGIDDLWDGDGGERPSAWLTVLRHEKSATVHTGALAGQPETVWVLNYSNFERLYYDLVVQFKVWSHVAHKLETWALMSYVRSEGEDMFATLLDPELRQVLRDHDTRGWGTINSTVFPSYGDCSGDREDEVGDDCEYPSQVEFPAFEGDSTARLDQATAHLATLVAEHLDGAVELEDAINTVDPSATIPGRVESREQLEQAMSALTGRKSKAWQHLPEIMLVRVTSGSQSWLYTIFANRIYERHERVYQEGLERIPEEDTLSIERGIIGHYPGLFVDLPLEDAAEFLRAVSSIETAEDWADIVTNERVGQGGRIIDRRDPTLWTFLDEVHNQWFAEDSVEAGVLDVSEYLWPQDL